SVVYPMMLAIHALLRARVDDVVGACASLHEAIVVASDKGDLPALLSALDYGLQALVTFGEAETAATISGALTGGLNAFYMNPTYEIPHRDRAMEEARNELGDDGYEA